jgi:ATP-binding cassette subfamily F protein 2
MIRVVFAILAMEHPHVILLDEPTNHLDMESIDSLAKAIKEFSGGVVIVSHDFRMSLSYLISDHELH